jgi:hypothetical protein
MNETNKIFLTIMLSGIIALVTTNYYILQSKYSLTKSEEENLFLKNKNEQFVKDYNEIKNINNMLLQQNIELNIEKKTLIEENYELKKQ